jgi:hypothetical protein
LGSASLEAIAGDRKAVEADLAAVVVRGDPGLRLARVTPEPARMLGPSAVRPLADAGDWRRRPATRDERWLENRWVNRL